jgi:hypothetical protein
MGALPSQKYEEILQEFVDYCNKEPKIIRLDYLETCIKPFLEAKDKGEI